MSSTQKCRSGYDYRQEYFKHNKGLFGCIYFCSQCYKPILKKDVEVDHIIPLSKNGLNHISNCTATCRKCNRSKSDKIDERVIKGYIFKLVEECLLAGSKCIMALLKLSLQPIKNTSSVFGKLMIAVLYILLIKAIINL